MKIEELIRMSKEQLKEELNDLTKDQILEARSALFDIRSLMLDIVVEKAGRVSATLNEGVSDGDSESTPD